MPPTATATPMRGRSCGRGCRTPKATDAGRIGLSSSSGARAKIGAYAVKLTSIAHDGDRDFLPIGSGGWDSKGRPSWVDIDQLYSVHTASMRREAAALDLERFAVVARALQLRYGWTVGG